MSELEVYGCALDNAADSPEPNQTNLAEYDSSLIPGLADVQFEAGTNRFVATLRDGDGDSIGQGLFLIPITD